MKLERRRPGNYVGRLEPYEVRVFRNHIGVWRHELAVSNHKWFWYGGGRHKTLAAAKLAACRSWLKAVLVNLDRALQLTVSGEGLATFRALKDACWTFKDATAPLVLRDWLVENGYEEQLLLRVVRPARKAKAVLPEGWGVVVRP